MFNFSGSELVFFVLIALVVLGPDKLPEAMRKAGKAYADFKKMTSGFQNEMRSVLDEPMRELRETAELAKQAASWDTSLTPPAQPSTKPVSDSMANHGPAFESVVVPKVIAPVPEPDAADAPAEPVALTPAPDQAAAAPAWGAADATTRRLTAQPPSVPPANGAPRKLNSPNFGSAAPRTTPPAVPVPASNPEPAPAPAVTSTSTPDEPDRALDEVPAE